MLGDSGRRRVAWPLCGEIHIFEQINEIMTGYGSIHCEQSPMCNLSRPVAISNDDFPTWAIRFNRRPTAWQAETLEWLMDGIQFSILAGADIGNQATWSTLAHSPLYVILNLAVGGLWPVIASLFCI
jgi:beta-glucanase (GH16 family)